MKTIQEIHDAVKQEQAVRIAIAGVTEEEVRLVKEAVNQKLAKFVLIGDKEAIKKMIETVGFDEMNTPIFHVDSSHDAPEKAMELIKRGLADIPMKGQVHTGSFIKAVLKKENNFFKGGRLSQVTMFDGYNEELQYLTDCAINIDYGLEVKRSLINNAVRLAKKFGKTIPKVALLGAVETVSESMPDTIDNAVLTQMNRRGQISDCLIDGPLSLDNAISEKFAQIKKIESPVAGKADILVANSLNEANSLSKGIIHYGKREACSLIAGTEKPVIMTSRTDTKQNKLNTIAAACYLLQQMKR